MLNKKMKNNSNLLAQTQCESSDFVLCEASVANSCPKTQGKLTPIHKVHTSENGIIQLNQKETNVTFYNEQVNSLFVVKELPMQGAAMKQKQLAQPLKRFNGVVSDTVGFAIFCILLIATGMLVWADFSSIL